MSSLYYGGKQGSSYVAGQAYKMHLTNGTGGFGVSSTTVSSSQNGTLAGA